MFTRLCVCHAYYNNYEHVVWCWQFTMLNPLYCLFQKFVNHTRAFWLISVVCCFLKRLSLTRLDQGVCLVPLPKMTKVALPTPSLTLSLTINKSPIPPESVNNKSHFCRCCTRIRGRLFDWDQCTRAASLSQGLRLCRLRRTEWWEQHGAQWNLMQTGNVQTVQILASERHHMSRRTMVSTAQLLQGLPSTDQQSRWVCNS